MTATGTHSHGTLSIQHIDEETTFDGLVDWATRMMEQEGCPGVVVGLSGTDSILAFCILAEAAKRRRICDRMVGLHLGAPWPGKRNPEEARRALELSPDVSWMERSVYPWLKARFPQACLEVDGTGDHGSDPTRWGMLASRALRGRNARDSSGGATWWLSGTRNRTEDVMLSWSNPSAAVSIQPILGLWKSEVLSLCAWLGVPEVATKHSRVADCDCGRFDLAAAHVEELDMVLRARIGEVSWNDVEKCIEPGLLRQLEGLVEEMEGMNGFKRRIPYHPPVGRIQPCAPHADC